MKRIARLLLVGAVLLLPAAKSEAQIPVIGSIITAVIQAIDVGVQKLQTETIYLQDAQRVVENTMSQLKLNDISSWLQKEKDLYSEYYQELWKVKSYISYYDRVKDIISKEQMIISEYNRASSNFQKDTHFTAAELSTMASVYSGLLKQSAENLDQINLVINSFTTQMSDAQRLKIIDDAGAKIDKNYADILQFDQHNMVISLQRTQDENDLNMVKQLYGLQ
jgi:hypothetical protein